MTGSFGLHGRNEERSAPERIRCVLLTMQGVLGEGFGVALLEGGSDSSSPASHAVAGVDDYCSIRRVKDVTYTIGDDEVLGM